MRRAGAARPRSERRLIPVILNLLSLTQGGSPMRRPLPEHCCLPCLCFGPGAPRVPEDGGLTRLLQKRSLGEAQECSPGAKRHRRGDPGSGGPHCSRAPPGATATPCPAEPAVAPTGALKILFVS